MCNVMLLYRIVCSNIGYCTNQSSCGLVVSFAQLCRVTKAGTHCHDPTIKWPQTIIHLFWEQSMKSLKNNLVWQTCSAYVTKKIYLELL